MKTERPFRVRMVHGILHLALDTPRASVNIFDRAAAEQLIGIFDRLPRNLRAIVFESGKPGSFINGARLMMASTVRSLDAARKSAKPLIEAYDLVERAPVPTIALVKGACFGCGVEFTLRCRYRLAEDTIETQFYMTELADYLLTPAFGSVSRLPKMLGLDRAADFLLWGERWSAKDALDAGLVDRKVRGDPYDQVEQILARPPPRKRRRNGKSSLSRHRERIERLPPSYQRLFRECLDQMASGGAEELALSAKTTAEPIAKSALGFFFVRQIAGNLARRGTIERRTDSTSPGAIARAFDARLQRAITRRAPAGRTVYHPDRIRPRALVEVANAGKHGASLVDQLERAGFVGFLSSPKDRFAIDALLTAHFAPILRAIDRGTGVSAINQTLRKFGFVERPHDLLDRFRLDRVYPRSALEQLRDPAFGGRPDPRLLDELCLSWVACARDLLSGTIAHPTIVDLAARELLDFPLEHRSLCSYLTRERVKAALKRSKGKHPLAEEYVRGKRDFYS